MKSIKSSKGKAKMAQGVPCLQKLICVFPQLALNCLLIETVEFTDTSRQIVAQKIKSIQQYYLGILVFPAVCVTA